MEIQIPKIEELEQEELKIAEPKSEAIEKIEKFRFSNLEDDLEFLEVVNTIPTSPPIHPLKRIIIYVSGTTYRLYVFDTKNNVWRYVNLS